MQNVNPIRTPKEVWSMLAGPALLKLGSQGKGVAGSLDIQEDGTEQRTYMATSRMEKAERHHSWEAVSRGNLGQEGDPGCYSFLGVGRNLWGYQIKRLQRLLMGRQIIKGDLLGRYIG